MVRAWSCEGSGITFASCQNWNISPTRNLVTFSLRGKRGPVYKQLHQHISLPSPGVIRANYEGINQEEPQVCYQWSSCCM